MKKILFSILFLMLCGLLHAQQLPIFSQYLNNQFMINPAIAGADGYTSINLTSRKQWVGLEGAPSISSISVQSRFIKKGYQIKTRRTGKRVLRPQTDGKVGLGGYLYHYKSGLVERTGFSFAYVYNIWIHRSTQLSLSLAASGYHFRIDEERIEFENPVDPVLATDLNRGIFVPDAIFGAYLLNERWDLGFSADQMLGGIAKIGPRGYGQYRMDRHFYLMGSYKYFIGKEIEIKPSFLLKVSEQAKPQADLGLAYYFDNSKNAYWAGITYRTTHMLIASVGIRADHLLIGYSCDFTLHELQRLTYGTHEITLAFKFGAPQKRFRWLNRY